MEAILLAAGMSKRMGAQKLLLPFGSSTVLGTVLQNLHGGGPETINAVVSSSVFSAIEHQDWLRAEINPAPERGQASSFAIGLSMLAPQSDFCVMLGDQPMVQPQEIRDFAQKFNSMPQDKTVLVPKRGGQFGHPMFYRAIWKGRFAGSSGDFGDKKILFAHEDEILFADAPDSFFIDIDTPEDYKKYLPPR